MISVQQQWTSFAKAIFAGINPSPVQVEEMRRAFYAGVIAQLGMNRTLARMPEEEGHAAMHALYEECSDFLIDDITARLR
jgi:hypothetical protein